MRGAVQRITWSGMVYLPDGFGAVPMVSIFGLVVPRPSPKTRLTLKDLPQRWKVILPSSLQHSARRLEGRKSMAR